MSNDNGRTAELYRMVTKEHICPYGLKARHLLQREGFCVGGGAPVPLGLISLTENLMMLGMALWLLAMLDWVS